MRGHIRKRGDSWVVVIELSRDPKTGKRRQQWTSFKGTKKQAERELNASLVRLEQGIHIKPTKITVGEYLESWLQDYVETNTSPRTQHRYSQIVRVHLIPEFGAFPLVALQPHHIQTYYANALKTGHQRTKGGLSPSTVHYHHRVLFEALKHAVKREILVRNVAEAVDAPRPIHKEMATLGPESVNLFLETAEESPHYLIFYTAIYTGLRRGEMLGLRWCDVDLDFGTLSIVQTLQHLHSGEYIFKEPKSRKGRRQIALSPSLAILLRGHKQKQESLRIFAGYTFTPTDLVFSHADGSPIRPNTVTRAFTIIARSIGLEGVRFHDLRHAHATLMLRQGIHPKIVSERLGHASISMTLDIYSHVLPGLQEAAALRFEEGLQTTSPETRGLQNVCKNEEKVDFKGFPKLADGDGSAWGIRTPDLRLERAVS